MQYEATVLRPSRIVLPPPHRLLNAAPFSPSRRAFSVELLNVHLQD
ncbi:hypothetical protein OOU_Y34scaffold01018g2 [Pyricularia oryzae Y34]|uniref:Uncharacterized protein n=2 Tax=Pyricularia oryzae TaxID=318829 RepID=A0AA97PFN1_PYRO3|nr:hypothetical protein OOU_Y34scaffold01018g2 [Pyricularia oryzae Y34]